METPETSRLEGEALDGRTKLEDFRDLSRKILGFAGVRDSLAEFLPDVIRLLLEYSGCDEIELALLDAGNLTRWRGGWRDRRFFNCTFLHDPIEGRHDSPGLDRVMRAVLEGGPGRNAPPFTSRGSFWAEDARNLPPFRLGIRESPREQSVSLGSRFASLAIIPLKAGSDTVGVLQIADFTRMGCSLEKVEFFENLAQTLGILLVNQKSQYALRERLKELTCLYGITSAIFSRDMPAQTVMEEVVRLIPQAWQFPDAASARILIEGRSYHTCWFSGTGGLLTAPVTAGDKVIGSVEVAYHRPVPPADEGPFLKEERALIDTIAKQIGLFWERRKAEEDKIHLSHQLRHADRLATLGQFTAGLAHDLNEPLSNILGFAQLAKKTEALPEQAGKDLDKIIDAVLLSREIVRKLLAFGRPVPARISGVDVNKAIDDSMYLFEGRCRKSGIGVVRTYDASIPEIRADRLQVNQIIVNLVSNAIHAMPAGGTLEFETAASDGYVSFSVSDTGIGMDPLTLERIFEPFFTTRDPSEGTGLGLTVALDIAKSHGGSIRVFSDAGKGSRFEVRLPLVARMEAIPDAGKPRA